MMMESGLETLPNPIVLNHGNHGTRANRVGTAGSRPHQAPGAQPERYHCLDCLDVGILRRTISHTLTTRLTNLAFMFDIEDTHGY